MRKLLRIVIYIVSFHTSFIRAGRNSARNSASFLTFQPNGKVISEERNQGTEITKQLVKSSLPEIAIESPEVEKVSEEYVLYKKLFGTTTYQRQMRPVRSHGQVVTVKVGMCLIMIEEIIEKDQLLMMAVCLKLRWTDHYLRWDPQNYNNLTWLSIPSTTVWLPDIAIVNSPEPYQLTQKLTSVGLAHTGEIEFYPTGKLVTRCNIKIKFFPRDWQRCEVRLESWIFPIDRLVLETMPGDEAVDMKEYYPNHEWDIVGYDIIPEIVAYDSRNFSIVTFAFVLQRKPMYYILYFVCPQILLALMQTLSSTLPVEHPGRMAMLTSLFIGTSVTQAGITDLIPKSSDSMSLLQIYMSVTGYNIVVSLIMTCVMMYSVLRYPNEEPSLTAIFFAFFGIAWPAKVERFSNSTIDTVVSPEKTATTDLQNDVFSVKSGSVFRNRRISVDTRSYNQLDWDCVSTNTDGSLGGNGDIASLRKSLLPKHSDSPSQESPTTKRKNSAKTKRFIFGRKLSSSECANSPKNNERFVSLSLPNDNNISPSGEKNGSATFFFAGDPKSELRSKPLIPQLLVSCGDVPIEDDDEESPGGNKTTVPQQTPHRAIDCNEYLMVPGKQVTHDPSCDKISVNSKKNTEVLMSPRSAADHIVKVKQPKRGEASACDERRDLKRRWLLYCVALDKVFMYVSFAWNIIAPIVIFVIVPELAPVPHVQHTR